MTASGQTYTFDCFGIIASATVIECCERAQSGHNGVRITGTELKFSLRPRYPPFSTSSGQGTFVRASRSAASSLSNSFSPP